MWKTKGVVVCTVDGRKYVTGVEKGGKKKGSSTVNTWWLGDVFRCLDKEGWSLGRITAIFEKKMDVFVEYQQMATAEELKVKSLFASKHWVGCVTHQFMDGSDGLLTVRSP